MTLYIENKKINQRAMVCFKDGNKYQMRLYEWFVGLGIDWYRFIISVKAEQN